MDKLEQIFKKIAEIIWSFFPKEASCINYYAQVFQDHSEYTIDFIVDDEVKWFAFGETPEVADSILELLGNIKKYHPFKGTEQWTHCHISLLDSGRFNIDFAYITEADSWPGLYMRGVSDLTEYEADHVYYVPKEIWAERVMQKNSGVS